jgi:hypothetical protein
VNAKLNTDLCTELFHGPVNIYRRSDCSLRIVTMRYRCAEDGHHSVPYVLIDPSPVGLHYAVCKLEETAQEMMYFFRIFLRTDSRIISDVSE